MIPAKRLPHTDARVIRCNECGQDTYVSHGAKTDEEIRAIAAKTGWSTLLKGKVTFDLCTECTVTRRRTEKGTTLL